MAMARAKRRRMVSWRPRNISVPSYRRSMLPLLSSPLASVCLPCLLWALCHRAATGLAASCGVGTSRRQRPSRRAGSNAPHPMLSASCDGRWQAWGRRPPLCTGFCARPGRSTGRLHQPHGRRLTPHRPTAYASCRTAPSGTTPLVRQRHSAMRHCRATATNARAQPATPRPLRLVTPPTPGPRRGPPAPVPVARLGEARVPGALAAVRRRGCDARSAPSLTTVRAGTPAKQCPHQPPRPMEAETLQGQQLPSLLEASFLGGLPPGATLRFPRRTLRPPKLVRRLHAQDTPPPPPRPRRPSPPPPGVAGRGHLAQARQASPLAPAHTLEARGRPGPLLGAAVQVPVPMPLVLRCPRGPRHHAPHLPCARVHASPHAQPLPDGPPLARGPTLATRDRKGGGIHPRGGAPWGPEQAVPPDACATGCITTHPRGAVGETQAWCSLGHCLAHALLVARGDTPRAGLVTGARGATELPGFFTPCTRHPQDTRRWGSRLVGGRWSLHGLLPPG
jgi:hypothetical protein